MANTTVACTNINLLKESQIPVNPSQNELYAVEMSSLWIPDYSRMTNVPFVLNSSWTATYDGILYCCVNNNALGIFIDGTRIIGISAEWASANIVLPKGQTITMDGSGGTLTFVPFTSST